VKSIRKVAFTDGRKSHESAREEHLSERRILYPKESVSIEEYITNGPRTEQSRANLFFFFSVKVKCGKRLPEASRRNEKN
tara:strand:+ start:221 stop:460 length:240 start_codon:yes stop_codon:yes gene_type:complete